MKATRKFLHIDIFLSTSYSFFTLLARPICSPPRRPSFRQSSCQFGGVEGISPEGLHEKGAGTGSWSSTEAEDNELKYIERGDRLVVPINFDKNAKML